jgi:hypothetical protein
MIEKEKRSLLFPDLRENRLTFVKRWKRRSEARHRSNFEFNVMKLIESNFIQSSRAHSRVLQPIYTAVCPRPLRKLQIMHSNLVDTGNIVK